MTFQELFPQKRAVIAMLHMKGSSPERKLERAKREIEIFYRCGVDAVLVENYFGHTDDCERALAYLQTHYPDRVYGVNILGDMDSAFALAKRYGAKFIQIDSVCGHLAPSWEKDFTETLEALRKDVDALVFGGVRFKYQPVRSGRTVEADLEAGKSRCDAVVVTGSGTGEQTPEEKILQFRETLGEFPLITGAGVTAQTVADTLKMCDGVIVGSWLKKGHDAQGEVCEAYVRTFVEAAHWEENSGAEAEAQ